ncbi:unnamed protein product, partial [Allacma fusca]
MGYLGNSGMDNFLNEALTPPKRRKRTPSRSRHLSENETGTIRHQKISEKLGQNPKKIFEPSKIPSEKDASLRTGAEYSELSDSADTFEDSGTAEATEHPGFSESAETAETLEARRDSR